MGRLNGDITTSPSTDFFKSNVLGQRSGLFVLFFTEMWERFSYYGIQPLLILYMAAMVSDGGLGLERANASAIVGLFAGSMYLMTIFGGWISDHWLG